MSKASAERPGRSSSCGFVAPRSPEGTPKTAPLVTTSLEEREFNIMQDYNFWNFWADLPGTFQSTPNWFKTLWLLIPVGFLLALIALLTLPDREQKGQVRH